MYFWNKNVFSCYLLNLNDRLFLSMVSEEQVNSYRQEERKIMNTTMSQYLDVCAGAKVKIALVETFIFICIQKPSTSLSSGRQISGCL